MEEHNLTALRCISCTPSKNGGFILRYEEVAPSVVSDPLGDMAVLPKKYSVKSATPKEVGFSVNVDLNTYHISIEEWVVDDETSDKFGQTINIYWLNK